MIPTLSDLIRDWLINNRFKIGCEWAASSEPGIHTFGLNDTTHLAIHMTTILIARGRPKNVLIAGKKTGLFIPEYTEKFNAADPELFSKLMTALRRRKWPKKR